MELKSKIDTIETLNKKQEEEISHLNLEILDQNAK